MSRHALIVTVLAAWAIVSSVALAERRPHSAFAHSWNEAESGRKSAGNSASTVRHGDSR